MLKKLLAMVAVLFLTACSSRMNGETTTICTNAPDAGVPADVVVTIEGDDEDIRVWNERFTMTREQFNVHFLEGEHLIDDEISELFDYLNMLEADGFELRLVALSDQEVVIEYVYDYAVISSEALNELWEVDDFEGEITLSAAIRGLESQGAICRTD